MADDPPPVDHQERRAVRPRPAGSTFQPINLERLELHKVGDVATFAAKLYDELKRVRRLRVDFYASRRRDYDSVLAIRKWLITLGIIALLSTALSAAFKFSAIGADLKPNLSDIFLGAALIAYAAMSAISFWESANAGSSAYFRGTGIMMALRDLWTQYEFDHETILAKDRPGADPDAIKAELLATARALVAAMDMLASTELGEWRGEVQASLTRLASVGQEGLATVKAELKANYDARIAKLEQAAKNKSYVTLQINGPLVGQAQISVDGGPAISSDNRKIALPETTAGPHRIQVVGKAKDGVALTADEWIELKPGIGTATIQVA